MTSYRIAAVAAVSSANAALSALRCLPVSIAEPRRATWEVERALAGVPDTAAAFEAESQERR
ncbi:hypothetical protein HC028_25155 [Planosporangium flavigriseum]|uniref:Uncharacterized protein n=1 Tax=Planosporangium flavigriseum TaxID=373681 RepID=A0A8J3PMZ2_9ACTN|nr:hypothetical protein [Planosporangium flavigriseum]NJC67769.1 hypothetical protein [Planosporangium flavigriseum]GIG76066.1 hypothetical protein Pfl04_44700 [Planosporangium flavigriseum]